MVDTQNPVMADATPFDSLAAIFGDVKTQVAQVGTAIQTIRNQIANAQAQTSDVAAGRWTLNNLAAQWEALGPDSQRNLLILAAIVVWGFKS